MVAKVGAGPGPPVPRTQQQVVPGPRVSPPTPVAGGGATRGGGWNSTSHPRPEARVMGTPRVRAGGGGKVGSRLQPLPAPPNRSSAPSLSLSWPAVGRQTTAPPTMSAAAAGAPLGLVEQGRRVRKGPPRPPGPAWSLCVPRSFIPMSPSSPNHPLSCLPPPQRVSGALLGNRSACMAPGTAPPSLCPSPLAPRDAAVPLLPSQNWPGGGVSAPAPTPKAGLLSA